MNENVFDRANKLAEKVNQREVERARIQGNLESAMKRLKDEFGLDSLEEAEMKLKEIHEELADVAKQEKALSEELDDIEALVE